jgi:hypothetical protein
MSDLFKKVCELFNHPEVWDEWCRERHSPSSARLCPRCGNPAEVEAVAPSREGIYRLIFLNCRQCSVWAVTPSDLQEPPVWVSSKEQRRGETARFPSMAKPPQSPSRSPSPTLSPEQITAQQKRRMGLCAQGGCFAPGAVFRKAKWFCLPCFMLLSRRYWEKA